MWEYCVQHRIDSESLPPILTHFGLAPPVVAAYSGPLWEVPGAHWQFHDFVLQALPGIAVPTVDMVGYALRGAFDRQGGLEAPWDVGVCVSVQADLHVDGAMPHPESFALRHGGAGLAMAPALAQDY
eukprot:3133146-Alexandrium_andersonii.AAC.1